MPLGLSRVLFVLDKSALIEWRTPMRSSGGFAKFPELQNGQHNGWPCAHFGSPTHFRRLTAILRTRSIWSVRVNLKNTRWLGAHGELTRQCISGLSPAKSRSAKMGANLPHARKAVTAEVASSSLVVPAILSKRVRRISLKPSRARKGHVSRPFCALCSDPQSFI